MGLNMRINQREQPTKLMRFSDYPGLLGFIAKNAVVFFDAAERRSWLVDGASALLHLVRNSLQRDQRDYDRGRSPYEWIFSQNKLQHERTGLTSDQAALKTLKNPTNLDLKLYGIGVIERDGQMVEKYVTLRDRISKIACWLEILLEAPAHADSNGIQILQSTNPHKYLTGYDILDVVDPEKAVHTRIVYFKTRGDGWMDLLPSYNATAIFGTGFGDLICPKDAASMCSHWKTVPTRQDHLCVSVSTLKLLHERYMERSEPTSEVGEMVNKLLWRSKSHPFEICQCTAGHPLRENEHLDPRQFLESPKSKWKPRMKSRPSVCVDIATLQDTGAVVFADVSHFNRKIGDIAELSDDILVPPDSHAGPSREGSTVTTSDNTQPTETTDMSNANEATTTMNTSVITSDSVQLTEMTDTPDMTDATTTLAAFGTAFTTNSAVSDIAVAGSVQSQTADASDTTAAAATMDTNAASRAADSGVPDIAVTGTPPSEGKEKGKGKGKGKMRRVKDFFRRR
jgi:hypothetical protein